MRVTTHLLFTFILLFFYFDHFTLASPLVFIIIALITTLIVDIDHPHSTAGKYLRPFSDILQWVLGHRGLLHSLLVPICIFLILRFFNYTEPAIAILLGYTSHIIMDILTPSGIRIFYPLKYKIRGPIKVGSWEEKILTIFLIIAIAIKLLFLLQAF
jgi:inner membrane protein